VRAGEFILTEGLRRRATYDILHDFISYAAEQLELKSLPKFDFVFDSQQSVANTSFGGYGGKHITVTVSNRHIMDCLRTLAHELVHFKQDLDNKLTGQDPGATGSPQENEANAKAAVLMRNWGKQHPEYFEMPSVE
jgi:hypothetical protein